MNQWVMNYTQGHKNVRTPSVIISCIIAQVYYQFTHFLNKIILSLKSNLKKEKKYVYNHTHTHKQVNN